MQSIIRSSVLLLCVTLVKSKNCTLEKFLRGKLHDSNFDTTGMEDSYANGRHVRVACNVGFSGFFKLTCENGVWKSKGAGCQPRSCGHPGDAPFADFHLVNGTDFVFGSKVQYICHKGYHMVSRRNHRNCMTGGWDGAVPVCEAQQCPVIHVDSNVKVIGDPEEAAFGNVVLFSCKSNSQVLKGPLEVYCDENGQWSGIGWDGSNPTCEEIKCSPPIIENGVVLGDVKEYQENELLNYRCNSQFKVGSGMSSKCMKVGQTAEWSPTPVCEPIKCHLELPALRGTTYEPASKSVFIPGDTLKVICGNTFWIGSLAKASTMTTCKADGEWTIRPVCQEVICSNQRDPHVSYWGIYYWQQKKIGDTADYTCRTGYVNTNGVYRATCTREGWTPNPLCQATHCQRLEIDNAHITLNNKQRYSHGEAVEYLCRSTRKHFSISCYEGAWTGTDKCPSDESCVAELPHGFFVKSSKNTIIYACDVGYKLSAKGWWGTAKCLGGQWSGLQECIETTKCGEPPAIPNGIATAIQRSDKEAQILQITCKKGYTPDISQLTCQDGNWHSNGASLETLCRLITPVCSPPPKVENAVVLDAYQREFLSNSSITYQCRENFTMEGKETIKCIAGRWEETNTRCIQKPCPSPEDIPNGTYKIIFGKEFVLGTTIKYTCDEGYLMIGAYDTRTCLLDGWTNEEPICERTTCKMDVTHPKLSVNGLPTTGEAMESGHILWFQCNDDYHLDGAQQTQCLQSGEWSSPFPTCSKTCKITGVPHNVNHQYVPGNELLKGRNLTFTCQLRNHFIHGHATVECLDNGQWSHPFPTCGTPVTCDNPPTLLDGDTKDTLKFLYNHNERVEFRCQRFYIMEGEPYKTCFNGVWRGDMKCLKPCTVNAEAMNTRNIRFKYRNRNKLYSSHNDEIEFECKRGHPVQGSLMRTRCLDGEIRLPTCQ